MSTTFHSIVTNIFNTLLLVVIFYRYWEGIDIYCIIDYLTEINNVHLAHNNLAIIMNVVHLLLTFNRINPLFVGIVKIVEERNFITADGEFGLRDK
ncbi:MAG: hypothetical protein ACTS78_03210 [Arsenophonus sp. NC-WZS1-MAG3]